MDLRGLARLFKCVSNEQRLRILLTLALKGPTTFSDLSGELNISGGKLNFHLKKLRDMGLVRAAESGAYELTETGRWVVARLSAIAEKVEETAPLVDFRGLPFPTSSVSELVNRLGCGGELGNIESLLSKLCVKFSRIQRGGVSGELLTLIAEVMFCDREPSLICVPRSLSMIAYRSLVEEECSHLRESLLQDLALSYAVGEISPLLRDYQSRGVLYVRDPARSIEGAQLVALALPRNFRVGRVLSKLVGRVSELVLVLEKVDVEEFEVIDRLIPSGKVTLVLLEPPDDEFHVRGMGVVYQANEDPSLLKSVASSANGAAPLILNFCEYVPSLSLAEVPLPEPGHAYVIPLRVALSLPTLYVEMKSRGLDGYHLIALIAEELEKATLKLRTSNVRRALRGVVDNVVEVEPQLALLGFESAMQLHHRQLYVHRLLELSKRFWSTVSKDHQVKVTAALADERVYSLSRAQGFTALSPFSLSSQRSLDELALLEGTVQQILRGGSVLAIKIKGYLSSHELGTVLSVARSHGVLRVSFHLEFTKCSTCSTMTAGRSGICNACLSGEVTQLIRPLTIYVPLNTVPAEVLAEYESRFVLR